MCLAYPMRIVSLTGMTAECEAKGVMREVNLYLVWPDNPKVGDSVLVHVGAAIAMVDSEEAERIWSLLDQVVEEIPSHVP